MAADNQPNYAKIGFFILAGVALVVGTLVYLGGVGATQHEFLAETHFSFPVSGLDVGSAVNFRGVRVGSVRRISFIGAEYDDIGNPHDPCGASPSSARSTTTSATRTTAARSTWSSRSTSASSASAERRST